MKRLIILSTLFALLLSACGEGAAVAPTEESLPVIVVDAEHMLTPNLYY